MFDEIGFFLIMMKVFAFMRKLNEMTKRQQTCDNLNMKEEYIRRIVCPDKIQDNIY